MASHVTAEPERTYWSELGFDCALEVPDAGVTSREEPGPSSLIYVRPLGLSKTVPPRRFASDLLEKLVTLLGRYSKFDP